jgi:DNA repair protein RadC
LGQLADAPFFLSTLPGSGGDGGAAHEKHCAPLPNFSNFGRLNELNNLLIRDMPQEERPRERLAKYGAESLKNSELLAILLRTGYRGNSAVHVAERLLARFEKLESLARAPLDDLLKTKGIGRDKAIALKSAFTLAQRMASELREEMPAMGGAEQVADLLRAQLAGLSREEFHVVLLNTRHRLIRVEKIGEGILDQVLVHAREVFKPAISASASAVILAHNHPSGDPTPSDADLKMTRDLIRAGQLLKIEVLDHVIFGARTRDRVRDYLSLRELGHFYA